MTWRKNHGGPLVPSEYVWVPKEPDDKGSLIAVVWADGSVALGRDDYKKVYKFCLEPAVLIELGSILAGLKVEREAALRERRALKLRKEADVLWEQGDKREANRLHEEASRLK